MAQPCTRLPRVGSRSRARRSSPSSGAGGTSATGTSCPPSRTGPTCRSTACSDTSPPVGATSISPSAPLIPDPHGSYWNPLRAGALTPFADYGAPVVSHIVTSRPAGQLFGLVNFIVEAFDHPPISAPPPWHDIPVTPALIRWRLAHGANDIVPWRIAADFRTSFAPDVVDNSDLHFGDVYAPGTRQNHPNEPGLFRFWLARGFDTRQHPDGNYLLEVEAADVRGNTSRGHLAVTFANAV